MSEEKKILDNEELDKVSGGDNSEEEEDMRPRPYIDSSLCTGCGVCADNCPMGCIAYSCGSYEIDHDKCAKCGHCAGLCFVGAIVWW